MLAGSYHNGFAPRDGVPMYPELWRGCVGAWAPCLGPTGLVLRDWSGFHRHGTLTNMDAAGDWVLNGGRYAVDFDGVNDHVLVGAGSTYSGTSSFSISFWMKGNETPALFMAPIWNSTRPADSWNIGWGFYWQNATTLRFFHGSWNANTIDLSIPSPQTWNHICVTVSGTIQTGFVNGIQNAQNSSGTASPTPGAGLVFGEANSSLANFACCLDAIAYHNRPLLSQEVRLLASRRGIAYDLAPRRRGGVFTASGFKAYWAARKAQILGGGLQ